MKDENLVEENVPVAVVSETGVDSSSEDGIPGAEKQENVTANVEVTEEVAVSAETAEEPKKKAGKLEKSTVKTFTPAEKTQNKKFDKKKAPEKPVTRREDAEFDKKLVEVRRVAKVVKGGRTMRFSALVVVGNRNGLVGVGNGKANEVPEAIEKATANAKRNLISVPIVGTTIPHNIIGKFGASSVLLFPAPQGTGVIAGGSARAVVELAGIKDIVTKSHGSNNKINGVKATIEGLKLLRTKEEVASLRGKSVEEI